MEMLGSLARIAAMDDDEQETLARDWSDTEELEAWGFSEVLEALGNVGDFAEAAVLEKKTLLIWTCL